MNVIVSQVMKKDNNNNCVISDDYKQYINKCGIYEFELEGGDKNSRWIACFKWIKFFRI